MKYDYPADDRDEPFSNRDDLNEDPEAPLRY